jgi:SAM-dependent methyltransferase
MNNTDKFTGRADVYAKARPSYAEKSVDYILNQLPEKPVIADIGAGTGKFSKQLAERGVTLFAVEPNDDMRAQLAKTLLPYPNAQAVNGTAESSTLTGHSVDAVVCAQAFHWFEPITYHAECNRILRPGGKIFIVDNWDAPRNPQIPPPKTTGTFVKREDQASAFFGGPCQHTEFPNPLDYDRDTYLTYMLSQSGAPTPGSEGYDAYCAETLRGFDERNVNGIYRLEYITHIYQEGVQ